VSYPRCLQQARPCAACCATPPAPSRTGTPPGPDALQESELQIFMTEGSPKPSSCFSRDILPMPACTHQKTPVPTAVPADIAEASCQGPEQRFYITRLPALVTPPSDIRAATAYHRNIAPDTGGCTLEYRAQCRTGVFLLRPAPLRRYGPVKGKSPREQSSPTAICRAGPATP
jgi:hypothetical protein